MSSRGGKAIYVTNDLFIFPPIFSQKFFCFVSSHLGVKLKIVTFVKNIYRNRNTTPPAKRFAMPNGTS